MGSSFATRNRIAWSFIWVDRMCGAGGGGGGGGGVDLKSNLYNSRICMCTVRSLSYCSAVYSASNVDCVRSDNIQTLTYRSIFFRKTGETN